MGSSELIPPHYIMKRNWGHVLTVDFRNLLGLERENRHREETIQVGSAALSDQAEYQTKFYIGPSGVSDQVARQQKGRIGRCGLSAAIGRWEQEAVGGKVGSVWA